MEINPSIAHACEYIVEDITRAELAGVWALMHDDLSEYVGFDVRDYPLALSQKDERIVRPTDSPRLLTLAINLDVVSNGN